MNAYDFCIVMGFGCIAAAFLWRPIKFFIFGTWK